MNLKTALLVLALSLPLAGCGNKGPLVLAQDPPPQAAAPLLSMPPMNDATAPVDGVPPPADDATAPVQGVPPPPGDDGNG